MPDPAPPSEALPPGRDAALGHLARLGIRGAHGRLERDAVATLARHLPTARAELLTAGRDGWVVAASTDPSRVGRNVPSERQETLTGLPTEAISTCPDPLGDGSACRALPLPGDEQRLLLCRDDGQGHDADDLLRAVAAIVSLAHGQGRAGATRDITADRASNEALQRALERERRATEELRAISQTKDALLSAISHELRTPLTVLRGFAELLLTHSDTLSDLNRDAAVVALERNARRLDELLTSILDLDRLGRGAMMLTIRDLPLGALIEEVIAAMELSGREIDVAVGDVTLRGDRSKLERVLENLLANAVKHGPSEAEVSVRAWPQDGGVTVAVEDRGRGIPDELAKTIFEPFERGAADPEVSGTGLGLALVRGFVELHGGRTWVEDRGGGGSSFRLWLPDEPPTPDPDQGR